MRSSSVRTVLRAAIFAAFVLGAETASAQFLGRKRPMRKASELIRRQEPPRLYKYVEPLVSPENSYVVISISRQRAWLMTGNEVYIDTPVSTGKRAGSTPTGTFSILEKDIDHRSSIYGDFVDRKGRVVRAGISLKVDSAPSGTRYRGAPMMYFMRLTYTGVGMHVGILPGYPASHGCIRLPAEIAPLIYKKVKYGTKVRIEP